MRREDLEAKFVDYLREKYKSTPEFVQFAEECYANDGYIMRDCLSRQSKDARRLILNLLDMRSVVKLASTNRSLFAILSDDQYWFRRCQRERPRVPILGEAKMTVMENRKRRVMPVRWFDIYNFVTHRRPYVFTLKTFLAKRYEVRIVEAPFHPHPLGYDWNIKYPLAVWPAHIRELLPPANNATTLGAATAFLMEMYPDAEKRIGLPATAMQMDRFSNIRYYLERVMISHMWATVRVDNK